MASVARRTLANVNSSAMIARHPDVPNLILVIRRSYQQDDGQTYRLCHMRVERAGRADCPDRSHRKTRCLRERPAGCSILLCLRSEEHTSELQSRLHLVCRLLLEKKKLTLKRCI